MTQYLSRAQVEAIHKAQVSRFGGSHGLRDEGALEAAVGRPQVTFGGEDLYPGVAEKAAALMHSLVMNHPFVDGNKRVGAHATIAMLLINGYEPLFSPADLVAITLQTAEGKVTAEALAIWFRQRTREDR
ncbi:MAG: type II toxin-antitoxin system death-on-curing family toxin [Vicinamibacteria bacterium]